MNNTNDIKITVEVRNPNGQNNYSDMSLPPDTDMATFKLVVEAQMNIPIDEQQIYFKNRNIINNYSTLGQIGAENNDMIIIRRKSKNINVNNNNNNNNNANNLLNNLFQPQQQQQQQPPQMNMNNMDLFMPHYLKMPPLQFIQWVKNNPDVLQQILETNVKVGEAILADDTNIVDNFLKLSREGFRKKQEENMKRMQQLQAISNDPLNPEYQKIMEQEINQENITHNYESAIENMPEAFGRVIMLYVPMEIEGHKIVAFVDSGAQNTIMTQKMAERCGLMRLCDRRFAGIAKGVGQAKIIGRVHMAKIKFGNTFFPCSFTILEGGDVEFLFGLDMLKRFQAIIDLKNNCLEIGEEKVHFLAEKDIPHLREQNLADALGVPDEDQLMNDIDNENNNNNNNKDKDDGKNANNANKPVENNNNNNNNNVVSDENNNNNNNNSSNNNDNNNIFGQILGILGGNANQSQSQPLNSNANANSNNNNNNNQPNPASIQALMNLGASRQEAINALRVTNGNVDLAANLIFQNGF